MSGAIIALILGFTLIPSGFIFQNIIHNELDKGIAEEICVPRPNSPDYENWISNDYSGAVPMYRRFYMWNLTNPIGFINGDKPEYTEIGPYVYREYTTKYNVSFSANWDEVTYKQYQTYEFETEMSHPLCSPDDYITNVNPAYLGVLELVENEENLIRVMFPSVLSEVKEMFAQELSITMEELLTNEGIYNMLVGALDDIISDLFSGILGEEAINLVATWIVDFLTMYIVPLEDLVEFMVDGMPNADEIFFAEWATDYFPEVQLNLLILFSSLLDAIDNLVDFIVDLIFVCDVLHLFDVIKNALKEELNNMLESIFTDSLLAEAIEGLLSNLIRDLGAEMVDEEGSETGIGVDIDGREPYSYAGPYADLNITNYKRDGETGITQEHCQTLWDPNNPNSLVGMDVLNNPIWFEALSGIEESRIFLKENFNLTEIQLNLILSWINTSIKGWLKNICEYTIKDWNSGLLTTRTVNEWLFTAVDNLVNEQDPSRAEVSFFKNCFSEVEAELEDFKSFCINTGLKDITKVRETIRYDGQTSITIWKEHETVQGTDGTQFAPDVSQTDILHVFISDILRSVKLNFAKTTSFYNIETLRFEISKETFSINPNYYQSIEGLANMTIEHEVPLFISKPHFLDADPKLINSVSGIYPSKELHDTHLDIEPITGIVMNAAERIQINLLTSKTDIWYKDCYEGIMPIVWLEFGGQITVDLANRFKKLIYGTLDLSEALSMGINILGATLIIPGVIVTTTQNRKRIDINTKKKLQGKKALKQKIIKSQQSNTQESMLEEGVQEDSAISELKDEVNTEVSEESAEITQEIEEGLDKETDQDVQKQE
ncbi:MAG: hypothetical protein ACFFA0_15660 [Promethearchaeota archaeon]